MFAPLLLGYLCKPFSRDGIQSPCFSFRGKCRCLSSHMLLLTGLNNKRPISGKTVSLTLIAECFMKKEVVLALRFSHAALTQIPAQILHITER